MNMLVIGQMIHAKPLAVAHLQQLVLANSIIQH